MLESAAHWEQAIVSQDAWNGQQSKWTARDGTTYTDEALIKTLRQIESGATIINGSWVRWSRRRATPAERDVEGIPTADGRRAS